jgi:hypothetical protein
MPESEAKSSFVPRDQDGLLRWVERIDASAIMYKEDHTSNWDRDAEIYSGEGIWNRERDGNPFFVADLISNKLERKSAILTASKPTLNVLPNRDGVTQTAELLQRVMGPLWDQLRVQDSIELLSAFARPFGCGFFKTVWDHRAAHGVGDIRIAALDPRMCRFDPYCQRSKELNTSQFFIHETSMPISWAQEFFAQMAQYIRDFDAPPPGTNRRKRRLGMGDKQIKSPLYSLIGKIRDIGLPGEQGAIPHFRLREVWFVDPIKKEGIPTFPSGRVLYVAGSGKRAVILNPGDDESQNPYFDGMWPFDLYDNRPEIEHPYGRSEVSGLKRLQESFNRIGHLMIRALIKNIPRLVVDSGAMDPKDEQRLRDFGDLVIQKRPQREVQFYNAMDAMPGMLQALTLIPKFMDMLTGLADDPLGGKGRAEVRSPDLLEGLQTASQNLINAQARRLETFLESVGTKIVSRILQFYKKDRLIAYVTSDQQVVNYKFEAQKLREELERLAIRTVADKLVEIGENEDASDKDKKAAANLKVLVPAIEETMRGAWQQFQFKITPLSSLSATRVARATAISNLVDKGLLPEHMVVQEAGFNNAKDLVQQAAKERAEKQAMGLMPPPQQAKGKGKR